MITQLGVWCLWSFNYPGPLLEVELESACLSGQGCGLCIALIRPNHWAASVAQWLEHLSSKQCVVGSNPTRAALFSFRRKKELFGLVAFPFFLFIEKSFHMNYTVSYQAAYISLESHSTSRVTKSRS